MKTSKGFHEMASGMFPTTLEWLAKVNSYKKEIF
jgi:hypothetical protein